MTAMAEERFVRRIGGIPVRNLYLMLAFSNALGGELSSSACGALEDDELPLNILARLLGAKLSWIRRRGMPRAYGIRHDVGALPEGAIDLPTTIRGMHLLHNRVAFRVDELRMDTPHNRLLCAGIRALLRSPRVEVELRDELRRQLSAFSEISYISTQDALRIVWRASRGTSATYREALGLARLALLASLPDEGAHDTYWRRLLDDQERMGDLFEGFVRGFLTIEFASRGRVTRRNFRWSAPRDDDLLPQLRTDLVIEHGDGERICVGECKLYKSPLTGADRTVAPKLRRDHLFQLFAYLAAASERYPGREIGGMLIYGRIGEAFDTSVRLRQFSTRIHTLGLHQPWPALRTELAALLEHPPPA